MTRSHWISGPPEPGRHLATRTQPDIRLRDLTYSCGVCGLQERGDAREMKGESHRPVFDFPPLEKSSLSVVFANNNTPSSTHA
jgi:hypothetical protein